MLSAPSRFARFAGTLGILQFMALLLTGCAVTTIDVDVYKGPLSNEEGVQTQQVASLAIAARPLLVELRNTLAGEEKIRRLQKLGVDDVHKFIPVLRDGTRPFDELTPQIIYANRVNGLLSLYEDLSVPGELGPLVKQGRELVAHYRAGVVALDYEAGRDSETRKALPALPQAKSPEAPKEAARIALLKGYQSFFDRPLDENRNVDDLKTAQVMLEKLEPSPFHEAQSFFKSNGKESPKATDHIYKVLANPHVVDVHMELIFGPGWEKKTKSQRVRDQTLAAARGFLQARADVEEGLDLLLQLVTVLSSPNYNYLTRRDELRSQTARAAASLIQPEKLQDHIDVVTKMAPSLDANTWAKLLVRPGQQNSGITDAIAQAILLKPESVSNQIRTLHADFKAKGFSVYGIVRGPTLQRGAAGKSIDELELKLTSLMAELSTAIGGDGYEDGRPPDGIVKLINAYNERNIRHLRVAEGGRSDDPDVRYAERLLHEALVHFAEKLLFVANYDALFQQDTTSTKDAYNKRAKPYARVLQAIGNEILNQVNEKRYQRDYDDQLTPAAGRETSALKRVLPRDAKDKISMLLHVAQQLDTEGQSATSAAAAAQQRAKEFATKATAERNAAHKIFADVLLIPADTDDGKIEVREQGLRDELTAKEKAVLEAQDGLNKSQAALTNAKSAAQNADADVKDAQNKFDTADADASKLQSQLDAIVLAAPGHRTEQTAATNDLKDKQDTDRQKQQALDKATSDAKTADAGTDEDKKKAAHDVLEKAKTERSDAATALTQATERRKAADAAVKSDKESQEVLAKQLVTLRNTRKAADETLAKANLAKFKADAAVVEADRGNTLAGNTLKVRQEENATLRTQVAKLDQADALMSAARADDAESKKQAEVAAADTKRAKDVDVTRDVMLELSRTFEKLKDTGEPKTLVLRVQAELQVRAANAKPSEADRLNTAWRTLRDRSFEQILPEDLAKTQGDPRQTVDLLISTYEYEYLEAVKAGGKDGPVARSIRQAIDAAQAYRAGMIHIRPPVAFLRSSYPISSLQSGTALEWRNMLGRHAERSMPFLGEVLENGVDDDDRRLNQDLDRQNWQNINRVRVAGLGITNYVMVKDDLGNWNVKSFSGDPEPIIKAAKSLVLFGASQNLGVDLIEQDRRRAAALEKGEDSPALPDSVNEFNRQAGSFRDRYTKDTRTEASDLNAKVQSLRKSIEDAWHADTSISAIDPNLNARVLTPAEGDLAAAKTALAKADNPKATVDVVGNSVADALASLVKYENNIVKNLGTLPAPDTTKLDAAKKELTAQQTVEAAAILAAAQADATVTVRQTELATAQTDMNAAASAESTAAGLPDADTSKANQISDATAKFNSAKTRFDAATADVSSARIAAAQAQQKMKDEKAKTTDLATQVTEAQALLDKQKAARANAIKIVVNQVGGAVHDALSKRLDTVQQYQTAVQVIVESKKDSNKASASG